MYVVSKRALTNLQIGDSYVEVVKFFSMVMIVMETEYVCIYFHPFPGVT